jgi:hypothetical protein
MGEPPIKSRLESPELTNNSRPIQDRLNACLASDSANIRPGQKGDHIRVIQQALNTIRKRDGLPDITDDAGAYDGDTTTAVRKYKSDRGIIRAGQKLDAIVGRMTLTRLDNDLLNKPAPPVPPAPVKAAIDVVAADIRKELAGDDDRDLEFLARLFEDERIIDTGTGNELVNRLNTILAASTDGSNNGVTHFAGIYAGLTDLGFRRAFKDPFPGKSDNQVGHFTTAVDMGFRPLQTFAILPVLVRAEIVARLPGLAHEEIVCVDLIIGHEQVADNAAQAQVRQALSPTAGEIRRFFAAVPVVTESPNQGTEQSRSALSGIRIGTGQGNSFQDLHLSLFGFKFGTMIRLGTITTRKDAALWIRTNIGTLLPNPLPPGPPTG